MPPNLVYAPLLWFIWFVPRTLVYVPSALVNPPSLVYGPTLFYGPLYPGLCLSLPVYACV